MGFFFIFLQRLQVATDLRDEKPVRIMERSIFSERYCFLETMHNNLLLSKPEYSLMDRWFQFASKHYKKYVQPDVIGKHSVLGHTPQK